VVFERLVYGFSPYGLPGNGTAESVASITRNDLRSYHGRYFAPNNTILAVVGDIGANDAFAAVERTFGTWGQKTMPADQPADPPPPTRRVVIVDKPDAVQTEIRVGQLAGPRKQRDFRALDLAVKILGGEGANRLHQVLRTDRSLTYGASAELDPLKRAGHLVATTNTRSESTAEALRLIVDEFAKLRRERVGERELSDAKAYLTGSYPLSIETPDDIATHVLDHVFYELPLEDLENYRRQVSEITIGDIARVTWETLKPDRLSIVLVGNAAAFLDDLRGVGFGRVERIPATELDLMAADFRKR
jgi:zinc protease